MMLTLGSIFAIVNMMDSGELDMTYQINASVSDFQYQDDNWLTQNRDYENMTETSQDRLAPERNTKGFWISEPINTTENFGVPQNLDYVSDMSDGEGNITVRTFAQDPSVDEEVIESQTFSMDTGEVSEDLSPNFGEDPEYIDILVEMEEFGDNQNQRPSLESYNLTYTADEEVRSIGFEEEDVALVLIAILITSLAIAIMKS